MKKILLTILLSFCAYTANAGVRPIGMIDGGETTSTNTLTPSIKFQAIDPVARCQEAGFKLTKCPTGSIAIHPCPYNNKFFFHCCPEGYRYTSDFCKEHNMVPSKDSCYGFVACHPKTVTEE